MGAISGNGVSVEEAVPLDGSQAMTGPLQLVISDTDNVVGLSVTQNDTTNNPVAASIVNAGTGSGLSIDQNGNGEAILIDSESTSTNVVNINNSITTTGTILSVAAANSLTTGRLAIFESDGADTSARDLVVMQNNNALATAARCLGIIQDAAVEAIHITQNASSSFIDYRGAPAADAIAPVSTLTTSGAIQGHIQIEVNGVKRWLAFLADPS